MGKVFVHKAVFILVFCISSGAVAASPLPPQPSCDVTIKIDTCREETRNHPLYGPRSVRACSAEILEVKSTVARGYQGEECAYKTGDTVNGLGEIAPPGAVLSGVLQAAGDEGGTWYNFDVNKNADQNE